MFTHTHVCLHKYDSKWCGIDRLCGIDLYYVNLLDTHMYHSIFMAYAISDQFTLTYARTHANTVLYGCA